MSEVVDAVSAAGRDALLRGAHDIEGAPAETGRWGPSLILLPVGAVAARLDDVTAELVAVLGDGHWPSGAAGRAHFTVRALEPYDASPPPPGRVIRYRQAADRALAAVGMMTLEVRGIVLTRGGVVATATSPDGSADDVRRRLGEELGSGGWLEDLAFPNGRDPFWYATLVHFASRVADPARLIAWVDARRELAIGSATIDELALCAWHFDGTGMRPVVVS